MTFTGVIVPSAQAGLDGGRPAALQHVANRPILSHVLDQMVEAGVGEVVLVTPDAFAAELRECVATDARAGLRVSYADAGSAGAVAELVGDRACVVHAADGLLTGRLAEELRDREQPAGALALVHSPAVRGTALAARRLMRLAERAVEGAEPGGPLGDGGELAGVCLLAPGMLGRAATRSWWSGDELDLAGLCGELAETGAELVLARAAGWCQYRGATVELLALNRLLLDALSEGAPSMSVRGSNRVEGPVLVHPTAVVSSSTLVGPALIGPHAQVLGSYIGPYTSIGRGTYIEGVEIERSIILPGARITHIGGRLVGSVVGRDARIFRDFSLPRALRLNVGDGGEVALC